MSDKVTSSIMEEPVVPTDFKINCYPNPFNPSTTISYELPISTFVNLNVYNILGQIAARIVNEKQEPGSKKIKFEN